MEKRFICFVCYHYPPEMRGVSQEEFDAGRNICKKEKCPRKGQELEPAEYCEKCDKLFRVGTHKH